MSMFDLPEDKLEPPPTSPELRLLVAIAAGIEEHGFVPSYREIAKEIAACNQVTVMHLVNSCVRKGYLEKRVSKAKRSLCITLAGWEALEE